MNLKGREALYGGRSPVREKFVSLGCDTKNSLSCKSFVGADGGTLVDEGYASRLRQGSTRLHHGRAPNVLVRTKSGDNGGTSSSASQPNRRSQSLTPILGFSGPLHSSPAPQTQLPSAKT